MTIREEYIQSLDNHSKLETKYLNSLELDAGTGAYYISERGFERGAFASREDAQAFANIVYDNNDDLFVIYKR